MNAGNLIVGAILRSPLHRVLSRSTCLIRYRGRRSGRTIVTPTQYAAQGEGLVILVGRHDQKTWWRGFRQPQHLDVLVRGRWRPMSGQAVVGADEPDRIGPLLDAYLRRFPRAARTLQGSTTEEKQQHAVVVACQPR